MSARRQINRYRTTPSGYDYADVLKRGKRFYTHGNAHSDFEMQPFTSGNRVLWFAETPTLSTFTPPKGTIFVHWSGKRWEESHL